MASDAVTAWEALFRAQVRVLRVLNAEFPDDALTFNEYDVMFNLSREPGHEIRMRDLTRNVLLSQSSLSRLVDRLVARGLIEKCEDPRDGRGTILSLTEAGSTVFRRIAREHVTAIDRQMTNALSATELVELARLCQKLQVAVPDVGPNPGRIPISSSTEDES